MPNISKQIPPRIGNKNQSDSNTMWNETKAYSIVMPIGNVIIGMISRNLLEILNGIP